MRFLLDTNVVCELRKPKPHPGVVSWLKEIGPLDFAVCALSFAEMQQGVELTRRQDPAKAAEIDVWLDELRDSIPVVPISVDACRLWARLMSGKPNQLREDGLIAAVAIANGLTVATRNVKDFVPFGVKIVNPFDLD